MRTSLQSRSSSWGRVNTRLFGFTLIELLISLAIITVITSMVIVRFRVFDSTVLLKNLAYEIATSIRQAQIYSVSVVNTGDGFRSPYGLSFSDSATSDANKTYSFCRYGGSNPTPACDNDSVPVNTFTLANDMKISDVCVVVSGTEVCGAVDRLDISFKRPEFEAIFYAPGSGHDVSDIERGRIKVQSIHNSTMTWVVDVGVLGQVSVYKE